MKKFTRYIAFAFFMLVLLLSALQQKFGLIEPGKLHGAFILAEKPAFSWSDWFTGIYQEKYEKYLEDHIGFRNFLVRVKNQIDFSLYHKTNAEGVIVGKDDYLYEYDYIRDYTGKDFVGMDFIRKKMLRAKFVQKYLKDSLNIDFVIIFEPEKHLSTLNTFPTDTSKNLLDKPITRHIKPFAKNWEYVLSIWIAILQN